MACASPPPRTLPASIARDRTSASAHAPTGGPPGSRGSMRSGIRVCRRARSIRASSSSSGSWSSARRASGRRKGWARLAAGHQAAVGGPEGPSVAGDRVDDRAREDELPPFPRVRRRRGRAGAHAGQAPSPGSASALPSCTHRVNRLRHRSDDVAARRASDANRPLPCADWRTAALGIRTSLDAARSATHSSSDGAPALCARYPPLEPTNAPPPRRRQKKKKVESQGIDPRTSRMRSERSTM